MFRSLCRTVGIEPAARHDGAYGFSRDDEVGRRGIAVIAGVRAGICMITVPTFSRLVRAAIHTAGVTALHP